jgi:hypothetical protein
MDISATNFAGAASVVAHPSFEDAIALKKRKCVHHLSMSCVVEGKEKRQAVEPV